MDTSKRAGDVSWTNMLINKKVNGDSELLAGITTKTEAGFAVAVPGSDTFQLSCFLGLAT